MPDLSSPLPSALRTRARWLRLGSAEVPAMVVVPDSPERAPVVLWMHGRTATKELDPGRYLRLMRAGFGVCAVDLPGHGERFSSSAQAPENTLAVIEQMVAEVDDVVEAVRSLDQFDTSRFLVGGMSAGGMTAMARLCQPHAFIGAMVEAASGSWAHQSHRPMFSEFSAAHIRQLDPIIHLDGWREVPFQSIHSRFDEWIDVEGQLDFLSALRARYDQPELVVSHVYEERTGAPFEHAGFGRFASDAKDRQRDFLVHFFADDGDPRPGSPPAPTGSPV